MKRKFLKKKKKKFEKEEYIDSPPHEHNRNAKRDVTKT